MEWYNWYIKCVTKDYFNFQGRARRKEFWMFTLISSIIYMILFITFAKIMSSPTGYLTTAAIYTLAVICPTIGVSVRRLHDTNRSGWWYLLNLIPIGGLIVFVFLLLDSTPGDNNYGKNPKI